jgi:hypothetical protein
MYSAASALSLLPSMGGVQRFDAEMGHSGGHTTIYVRFFRCLMFPHIAIFYGPFEWVCSLLLSLLPERHVSRDYGQIYTAKRSIDLYTLEGGIRTGCILLISSTAG